MDGKPEALAGRALIQFLCMPVRPLHRLRIMEGWHRIPATVEETHGRALTQFLCMPVRPLHRLRIMEGWHRTPATQEEW